MADEKIVPENGLEVRYERYKGIIKNFTLMSDIFMRNVFKQRECLEYVLQVIMEKQDLKVIEQIIQKDYKNLKANSLMWRSSRIMKVHHLRGHVTIVV